MHPDVLCRSNSVRALQNHSAESHKAADLRRIPGVIAVAGGSHKTAAIRSALSSDLIDTFIINSALEKRFIGE